MTNHPTTLTVGTQEDCEYWLDKYLAGLGGESTAGRDDKARRFRVAYWTLYPSRRCEPAPSPERFYCVSCGKETMTEAGHVCPRCYSLSASPAQGQATSPVIGSHGSSRAGEDSFTGRNVSGDLMPPAASAGATEEPMTHAGESPATRHSERNPECRVDFNS